MMNKRGSRFIAWLLALVMILNVAPVSAFAATGDIGGSPVIQFEYIIDNGGQFDGNLTNQWSNVKQYTTKSNYAPSSGYVQTENNKDLAGWVFNDGSTTIEYLPGEAIDLAQLPDDISNPVVLHAKITDAATIPTNVMESFKVRIVFDSKYNINGTGNITIELNDNKPNPYTVYNQSPASYNISNEDLKGLIKNWNNIMKISIVIN